MGNDRELSNRSLPPEILAIIIENIAPPDASIAFPASHVVTRTLHACLTLSKATSWVAQQQIRRRCLYINSAWRLKCLLRSLDVEDSHHRHPFLIPLSLKMESSTSMYLSPFPGDTIDDAAVVTNIKYLFALLSDHLQRLVVNMPLRSMSPDDPSAPKIRPALRDAFAQLTSLEDFVSVQDELCLDSSSLSSHLEPQVWASWPCLKCLGLYNVDIRSQSVRKSLRGLPHLETLVLTRPHGLVDEELAFTMSCLNARAKVIVVNTLEGNRDDTFGQHARSMVDLRQKTSHQPSTHVQDFGKLYRVDVRGERSTRWAWGVRKRRSVDDITTCQNWIEKEARDGTLWTLGMVSLDKRADNLTA